MINSPEEVFTKASLPELLDERARLEKLKANESSLVKKMNLNKQIKRLDKQIMSSSNLKKK